MTSNPIDPTRRLICFLGINKYGPVRWRFSGAQKERISSVTPWVPQAIAEIIGRPNEIFIVATREAWEFTSKGESQSNSDQLMGSLEDAGFPKPIYKPITKDDIWTQFDILKDLLRAPAAEIILDISYGFRSIPFFGAAVTAFIYAIEKVPPIIRVFYGAYDDRKENIAPLLEFTEFIALLDWAQALRMFLHTGRAEEAAMLTGVPGSESEPLHELSEAMKAFSLDLQTLRTGNLLIERDGQQSSATRLLRAVEAARADAGSHLPPLAEVLNELIKMVEPLASDKQALLGDDGHKAVSALAHLYLNVGRYLEAAVTIREGGINKFASKKALRPGASDFNRNHRDKAEKFAAKNNSNSETIEIKRIRNDMSHAQYVRSPKSASEIISAVDRAVGAFFEDRPSPQPTECVRASDPRGNCFVNLTNHPSTKWDAAQTKAALALAERIEDIAFSAVPPDADETAIEALAETCMAQIPPETSHALVQGEFTLTVELVRRLQARGITCLAATSTRDFQEVDGRRVSTFTFVRFRAYAEPGRVRCR